jgi:hypothetical protein
MSEQPTGEPPILWGTYYPEDHVVATIAPTAAQEAADSLREAGWADDEVRVLASDEALARYRTFVQHRSLLQRIGAAFSADEGEAAAEYVEAAEQGESIVIVHADAPTRAEQAAAVLGRYGARRMYYYEQKVVRDLSSKP